jgi:hypothetical protein
VLISLWLFLFAAQPKEFVLDGLNKLEQGSHKCVELTGNMYIYFFNPVACCFITPKTYQPPRTFLVLPANKLLVGKRSNRGNEFNRIIAIYSSNFSLLSLFWENKKEAYEITLLSVYHLLFFFVFYVVRVVSKERSKLVLPRTSCYIYHNIFPN